MIWKAMETDFFTQLINVDGRNKIPNNGTLAPAQGGTRGKGKSHPHQHMYQKSCYARCVVIPSALAVESDPPLVESDLKNQANHTENCPKDSHKSDV
jgi:hypothetical protein